MCLWVCESVCVCVCLWVCVCECVSVISWVCAILSLSLRARKNDSGWQHFILITGFLISVEEPNGKRDARKHVRWWKCELLAKWPNSLTKCFWASLCLCRLCCLRVSLFRSWVFCDSVSPARVTSSPRIKITSSLTWHTSHFHSAYQESVNREPLSLSKGTNGPLNWWHAQSSLSPRDIAALPWCWYLLDVGATPELRLWLFRNCGRKETFDVVVKIKISERTKSVIL